MTGIGVLQLVVFLWVLLVLSKPLGWYMAQVYSSQENRVLLTGRPVERVIYRLCGIHQDREMTWVQYLLAMLLFNFLGFLSVYLVEMLQGYLPLNPQHLPAPSPTLAFNIAASFVSNTDWQSYAGETTLSYLAKMLALTTWNFLSAATGMSLLLALIRGIVRQESRFLGNFWVDLVRGVIYILLPLSFFLAIGLVSQGVIQNLLPNQEVVVLQPDAVIQKQVIPMGPVASQVAIKQLGTNGGGFFSTNAAHPFENPTPFTNFLEMLAILLIPAALCNMFGMMVQDKRQGLALLTAMVMVMLLFALGTMMAEQAGNPAFTAMGVGQDGYSGGNMEGKETRFGIVGSSLWAVATTAASNGSVNAMLDSFMPLGGMLPLWLMQLGEVIFGGAGSGLYGMLMLVVIAVFITGLMVGRTPEYLGKKIEPFEMKMASVAVLIMPLIVLLSTAIAAVSGMGAGLSVNHGVHGFTEMLYAFTSMGNNNGSAFAGLNTNTPFYNVLGGVVMLAGRYLIAVPVLAIAGSLAAKKQIPVSSGTLVTWSPLFVALLICVIMLLGALAFLPSLALGPIVEHLTVWGRYG